MDALRQRIRDIEHTYRVQVIFAALGGSRAWGLNRPDSDYDLRFVFSRRVEEYLKQDLAPVSIVTKQNDNIESQGWDIRKAFKMLGNSNPNMLEMFTAPEPIVQHTELHDIAIIANSYFSAYAMTSCYRGLTQDDLQNYHSYQDPKIRAKSLVNAVRGALNYTWVQTRATMPPQHIYDLLSVLEPDVTLFTRIRAIVKARRNGEVLDDPGLAVWAAEQTVAGKGHKFTKPKPANLLTLDKLTCSILMPCPWYLGD